MKVKERKGQIRREIADKGFSLVEVLVCIAILAIISVPILAAFRTSALYTNRAHKTQKVTAYAQDILETVKSTDVTTFINSSGCTREEEIDSHLQAKFPSYSEELFKKIKCEKKDIVIDGDKYDMEVIFDPTDYSQKKEGEVKASELTSANDANVYEVNEVNEVDGMLFPVIAEQINQYEVSEGGKGAAVLYNLDGLLKKNQKTGNIEDRIEIIYGNLTKTVKVTIEGDTSGGLFTLGTTEYVKGNLKVNCDVIYESEYNGAALKQIYNVFSGNYELLGRTSKDGAGNTVLEEWEKGGNVYIFAKAFQDQNLLNAPKANKIEIENLYTGIGKLDVYLVRGYYFKVGTNPAEINEKHGLQFDQVMVNGTWYLSGIPVATPLTGEWTTEGGNTHFHTNIKGIIGNRDLQTSDFEQTVGAKKPSLRCYKVTIKMTEQSSGDEVVNISTTKEIR